ncbi:MAG: NAD-dependent epimerase/dehydratase family protein [Deltaproteobacteria bacterium]|nr:NAD-dependent epimerase/dehydratase family protein [Deltaproteobacteria bacterium]
MGSALLKNLEESPRAGHLLALDVQPPPFRLNKAGWKKIDLTETGVDQKLNDLFRKHRVEILVHAALLNKPIRNLEQSHELQSVGTMHLLTAAAAAKVGKLILASTTDVYGAFPDNPNFLTEAHPPRAGQLSSFLRDKVEVEEQFLKFQKEHAEAAVTLLRPATILGPTVNNFKTHFLQNPVIPSVMGFDPLIQFVHEQDVLRAFLKVIHENHPGLFNIVARGVLPLSRAIRLAGSAPLPLPSFILYPSAELLWNLNIGAVPGSHLNFLKYLCVADGKKAWKELDFKPVYTSEEALLSFKGRELKAGEMARRLKELENAKAE